MSFAVKSFLGKVKSEEWTGKPFAAFDTENPETLRKRKLSIKNGAQPKRFQKSLEKNR
jgi:hypothetical protein